MQHSSGLHPPVDRAFLSTAPGLFGVYRFDVRGAAEVPAVGIKGEELDVPWEGHDRGGPKNLKIDLELVNINLKTFMSSPYDVTLKFRCWTRVEHV